MLRIRLDKLEDLFDQHWMDLDRMDPKEDVHYYMNQFDSVRMRISDVENFLSLCLHLLVGDLDQLQYGTMDTDETVTHRLALSKEEKIVVVNQQDGMLWCGKHMNKDSITMGKNLNCW